VDDPPLVGPGEGPRHGAADGGHPGRRQRTEVADLLGEALPLDVLHHEPVRFRLVDDVEDTDGVRVVERGGDPRLAHGPRGGGGLPGQGTDALDGDLAPEDGVAAQPHGAHAAAADGADHLVASGDDLGVQQGSFRSIKWASP
jgi:hypothetical protein